MVSWLEHNRADAEAPMSSKRCLLCTRNTIDMRARPRQIMVQPAPSAYRRTSRAPPSRPRPGRIRAPREEHFHHISPRNVQAIMRALQS